MVFKCDRPHRQIAKYQPFALTPPDPQVVLDAASVYTERNAQNPLPDSLTQDHFILGNFK